MKGDFSRTTYNHHNHYIGVRWQQARPTTDADANEAQDIVVGRIETADGDTVGVSGGPKIAPGFALSTDSAGLLQIGQGHYFVDGILVENDATVSYNSQPYWPDVTPLVTTLSNAEVGLVFLEVFKRHLTHHDNPNIRDVALNGLDTTTRLEIVWRVHVLPLASKTLDSLTRQTVVEHTRKIREIDEKLADTSEAQNRANILRQRKKTLLDLKKVLANVGLSCEISYPEYDQATKLPTGTLTVTAQPSGTEDNPCNVPESGGYTRGENQYYAVQVHSVPADSSRNGATFKFSRDNGSIVALIKAVGSATSGTAAGTVFDVDSVQRDDYLGIHVNDWVEYVDDWHELNGSPGILAQVAEADVNLHQITVDRPINVNLDRHPKLRKWDQVAPLANDAGVAMNITSSAVAIEGGIRLLFSDGSFRPGDYWQFAARAVDASIDFPPGAQPPMGVKRHYAPLGIILMTEGTDGVRKPELLLDCRKLFPPLTGISAEDVSFDNSECQLPDVATVQDAIETLCDRTGDGGPCSFVVSPSPSWFEVFSLIPEGGDAEICFRVGEYLLDGPVQITRKGALKLVGAGTGTRIRVKKAETALAFQECVSVIVEDLFAESTEAGSGPGVLEGLKGVLSFTDCTAATIRRVTLRCPASVTRAAACVRVINRNEFADIRLARGSIDVQDCFFQVGNGQLGALVINGARIIFNNNVIRCQDLRNSNQRIKNGVMIENSKELRAALIHTLVSDVKEGEAVGGEIARVVLKINNIVFNFRSDPELNKTEFFKRLKTQFSSQNVKNVQTAENYLKEAIDAVLRLPDASTQFFGNYFKRLLEQDLPAIYQGITIGGEEADEVRIINNTVIDALQGIHIGQSRHNQPKDERLRSTIVTIEGNAIYSRISPTVNREAYGIYVGNCDSLMINNNTLRRELVSSTGHLIMDGIHVEGELGWKAIIRDNETRNYPKGVFVNPTSSIKEPLWIVADNVATVTAIDIRVLQSNNKS